MRHVANVELILKCACLFSYMLRNIMSIPVLLGFDMFGEVLKPTSASIPPVSQAHAQTANVIGILYCIFDIAFYYEFCWAEAFMH